MDVIILGAFGCGAFKNPPLIVAEAFRQVIDEQNYCRDFKQILFAIKSDDKRCRNLSVFSTQFDAYASDANERCSIMHITMEDRFYKNSTLPIESKFAENREFRLWQMKNIYFGKQFSVLVIR